MMQKKHGHGKHEESSESHPSFIRPRTSFQITSDEAIPSPLSANYVGGPRAMSDSFFEPFLQPEFLGRGRTESVTSEIRSCPCPLPSLLCSAGNQVEEWENALSGGAFSGL